MTKEQYNAEKAKLKTKKEEQELAIDNAKNALNSAKLELKNEKDKLKMIGRELQQLKNQYKMK